jgi:MoxR-like ATPase
MSFLEVTPNKPLEPLLDRVRLGYQSWCDSRSRQTWQNAPLLSEEERYLAYAQRYEEERNIYNLLMPIFREQSGQPLEKTDLETHHDAWFLRLLQQPHTPLDCAIQDLVVAWSATQPDVASSFKAAHTFLSHASPRGTAEVEACQKAVDSPHGKAQWHKSIAEHERFTLTQRVWSLSTEPRPLAL